MGNQKLGRLAVLVCILAGGPAGAAEYENVHFFDTYLAQLEMIEGLREQFLKEPFTTANDKITYCISTSTRFEMELTSGARQLKGIKLPPAFKDAPELMSQAFQDKADLFGQMKNACKAVLKAKTADEVQKVAAELPELRAKQDFADKMIFNSAPMLMFVLVSPKPDKEGHMSHLLLTRQQMKDRVKEIETSFPKMNVKNPTYIAASAKLLRDFLANKGYKGADEP